MKTTNSRSVTTSATHTISGTKRQKAARKSTMYWATWVVLVVLFAVSFVIPPIGMIDGSVLRAGCIILAVPMLASMESILASIKKGQRIKLQHGSLSAEVTNTNN